MLRKFAIIDTETSGLFDFSKPADAPGQPRLATLAVILVHEGPPKDDGARPALAHHSEHAFMVKPDGWEVSPEASKVNGLTTEHLLEHGKPVLDVLAHYSNLVALGYVVVAFNAQFDTKVMRGELRRASLPDLFESTPNICVMRAATNVVRVPRKTGSGYKFPKLSEACAFFKIAEPAAHSALGDARSAFEVFQHLHRANLLPEPEVHFAKEKPSTPAT